MLRKRERLLYLAVIALLAAALVWLAPRAAGEAEPAPCDGQRFRQEYEALNGTVRADGVELAPVSIPADNPFVYVSAEEARELARGGTGVLYIGAGWCRLCRLAAPLIAEAAGERGMEVHYLPVDGAEGEAADALAEEIAAYLARAGTSFANVTGSEAAIASFAEAAVEEPALFPSLLLFYNKGTLTGMHVGTASGHEDSALPLELEQRVLLLEAVGRHMEVLGSDPCPVKC